MLAISLILCGLLLRIATHAPNVTPVAAIALFAGVYLNRKYAFLVPLLLMIMCDFVIGLHNVIPFTWGAFIAITFLGLWVKKHKSFSRTLGASLVSSVLFYIVTNFGVWAMGWYPPTMQGLVSCYVMGLPFLRDFTLSTLAYTALFFGAYELIARSVKDTKLAKVLLTD